MNYQITYFINHLGAGTWLDSLTLLVSSYYFLVIILIVLLLLVYIFDRKNFLYLFFILVIALIIDFLVTDLFFKHGFITPTLRPYLAHQSEIFQLGVKMQDSSFPSGHMSSILAVSTVFWFFYRRLWPFALIFALFMAFARVHNGMHYLTDVISGAVLGIVYAFLARWIFHLIKKHFFAKI